MTTTQKITRPQYKLLEVLRQTNDHLTLEVRQYTTLTRDDPSPPTERSFGELVVRLKDSDEQIKYPGPQVPKNLLRLGLIHFPEFLRKGVGYEYGQQYWSVALTTDGREVLSQVEPEDYEALGVEVERDQIAWLRELRYVTAGNRLGLAQRAQEQAERMVISMFRKHDYLAAIGSGSAPELVEAISKLEMADHTAAVREQELKDSQR